MSRRTSIIIALAVVVVAIATYIIIRNIPEKPYERIVSDRITHLNAISSDIATVKLERANNDVMIFERKDVEVDGRTRSAWRIVEPVISFEPKSTAISDIAFSMSNLYSETIIEETPSDLSIYGLDEPVVLATVTTNDGDVIRVKVGAKTPTGVSYYAQVNDEETVYTMRKYTVDKMMTDIDYFRETLIPVPDTQSIVYLRIENERTIEIMPREENDEYELAFTATLKLKQPYTIPRPIDSQRFEETLELIPASFAIVDFAEDNPSDLSIYGLDNPRYEFEMYDAQGGAIHMLFGDEADESHAYAKMANLPAVFTLRKDALEILQADPFNLASKFLLIVDIKYVDSFVVTGPDAVHTARIDRTGENYDPETEDGALYYIDDVEIEDKPFKQYYMAVIGLLTDAENPDPQPLANADVTVEFNLNDRIAASYARLDLVEVNKDFYAAYRNGFTEFLVSDYQVESMFDVAADLLANASATSE